MALKKTDINTHKISEAFRDDFWEVYNLYKSLMQTEPLFSESDYIEYLNDDAKNIALLKNSNGKSIGLIAWIVWPGSLSFPLDVCFIQDLIISPENRKLGLGSFLLEHVKKWAKQKDIHIVHLQTDAADAIEFYQKNGFESRNTGLFCFLAN